MSNSSSQTVKTGGSVIAPCSCESKFQDETYGKGQRVFAWKSANAKDSSRKKTCTVCGTVK
jgi:hypothetical protein